MERSYSFSPELLQMMLSEERQKFVAALGKSASLRELNLIRKNIAQINALLDSYSQTKLGNDQSPPRSNTNGLR